MKQNYFDRFSDQQLIDLVEAYSFKDGIPLRHPIRTVANDLHGKEDLGAIMYVAIPLLQAMTERLKIYSPHIEHLGL